MRSTLEEPRNLSCMLMHEVLGKSGRGPPEILCVIHASVCQRVGLPVHLMRMPMRGCRKCCPGSVKHGGMRSSDGGKRESKGTSVLSFKPYKAKTCKMLGMDHLLRL
eukprot:1141962-Pelagomonas_calceolata.AAC.9